MKVVDKNGKEFDIELRDIEDMDTDYKGNGPIKLHDSESHPMTNFVTDFQDAEGKKLDINQLLSDINSGKSKVPAAIDVLFEATHTGANLNDFVYHSDSMVKDAETWKAPFPKPFIKNHDVYEEPLGRVRDAWFEQSEFNPDRDCINVNYRITDQDAIMKFLDGRYKTMSVGGKMGTVTCGLCGKTILKDGVFKFCGHWRGETYNGQKALWNGRDITYKEGSVVNTPADVWAQVKRITVLGDALMPAAKKPEGKDNEGDNMNDPTSSIVDNLLDPKDPKTNPDKTTDNDPKTDPTSQNDNETVETLKAKLTTANDTIKNLNETILQKDADLQVKDTTISELNEKVTLADTEKKALRDQAVAIAVQNKKLMAQRIADYMLFNKEITDTDLADKVTELSNKKASDLTTMCDGLKVNTSAAEDNSNPNKTNPANPKPASNPGLANDNEPNAEITDNDNQDKNEKDKDKPKAKQSFKDLEDVILKVVNR